MAVLLAVALPVPVLAGGGGPSLAAVESFVARTSPSDEQIARASDRELLRLFVRCVPLGSGTTYCLHVGWPSTGADPGASIRRLLDAAAVKTSQSVGATSLLIEIRTFAALPRSARVAGELEEIRTAHGAAATVAEEDRTIASITQWVANAGQTSDDPVILMPLPCEPANECYPSSDDIGLAWQDSFSQNKAFYCGPATTRMAAMWKNIDQNEDYWFARVEAYDGANFSTLDKMVSTLNSTAGGYSATADRFTIKYFTSGQVDEYMSTVINRIWKDNDPAISSVMLKDEYFSYLSADYNGHFQLIKGYTTMTSGTWDPKIKIYEPFDEARFYSGRPATAGPHTVTDNQLYQATMANQDRIAQ